MKNMKSKAVLKLGRKRKWANDAERQKAYRFRSLSEEQKRVLQAMHDQSHSGFVITNPMVFRALERRGYVEQVPGQYYVTFRLTFAGAVLARKLMGF